MSPGAVVHAGGPTEEALFAFRAGRLHPEAAGWIGDHVDSCQRCRRAMARIEAISEALEPPPEPPFMRQADITAVRRRLERRRPVLSRLTMAACAGALAGFALVLALKQPHRGAGVASGGDSVGFAIAARQGVADIELGDDHAVAEAKMGLPTRGWLTVAPKGRVLATWGGARVAVEGGATGARVQLATSLTRLRQLTLERGSVVLDVDPLATGAELIVATADARVSVHGTRFLVDSSAAGTQVACDRGRVRVASGSHVVEVPAGTQLAPGAAAPGLLSAESGLRLSALEQSLAALASGPTESLEVFADVADATVAVDGIDYGRAPLSLAVTPGSHAVRVRAAGRLPVEERVEVGAGTPTLFRAELLELSLDEPAAGRAPPAATGESPEAVAAPPSANQAARDALGRARSEVLAGAYDRAIAHLQQLRAGHAPRVQLDRAALLEAQAERLAHRPERALPLLLGVARSNGPEAEQAQFQLAQTFGHDLHDPLRAANAYADSERRFARGIFAEEAAFRRGESLLAGGDTRAGLEALEDYLRRFPTAPHADDAHLFLAGARRDRLGDCAGAVPHLQAVAAGRGLRAQQALIGAARCLHTLGRQTEASAAYERYLQLQPHGRYADEAHLGATGSARLGR